MEDIGHSPLFVDLDGTYTKTDLLFESFLVAIKQNPLILFYCLFWLLKGKAYLKYQLSLHSEVKARSLPLNKEFYSFLLTQKKNGRKLYLATATNEKFARAIIDNDRIFDGYISSTEKVNLKGKYKLQEIKKLSPNFSYAGNDAVDFEIFQEAEQKLLVNPSYAARKKISQAPVTQVFDLNYFDSKAWLKQLRVHQWLKNLLIFVPLFVAGQFTNIYNIAIIACAFFAFSLLASATYIINDLLDLESDRAHSRKRNRPLASGQISIQQGMLASLVLFVVSISLSLVIGLPFFYVILMYLCLTLFYSFKVKQYIAMDVLTLALLYTIRIFAGAAAIGVVASFWLIAFSIFVFLSLALVKRCSEIQSMGVEGKKRAKGRDYTVEDYAVLKSFGASSAMMAVLMFCFYINNNVLTDQYQQPNLLWLIVPALCYWLMRMWIKTHRGEMHDDPIVFSFTDKGSLTTIGFCALITVVAQIL